MHSLHYAPKAQADLLAIQSDISQDLASPSAAQNTLLKITRSIRNFIRFPHSGVPLSSVIEIETKYRFLVCGNYTAFYHIDGTDIFVDRIIYAKRDYIAILFNTESQQEI